MKFSLVIPCYNESKNIPALLEKCANIIIPNEREVILVDNGSTDDTPATLQEFLPKYPGCRSVRVEKNQGYGFGILSGLKAASGDILGWTHADLQTDPTDTLKALELFNQSQENSFVKGKRYGRPLSDVFFTVGMSFFESILLRTVLWDINAQPNIFTRQFFESWQTPPHDFSLDLYVYYCAKKQKIPVLRFPVHFGERLHGASSWNVDWASKKKFIKRTIEFSLNLKKGLAV